MASNQSFVQKWRISFVALLVILMCQLLAMVLLNALVNEFSDQTHIAFAKPVILTIVVLICIVIDLYFIYNKIVLLRSLANETPIRCVIDDVLFVKYKDEKRIRYTPYLIVRSTKTNKRYFTYGKYSLLGLTASVSYGRGQMIDCTIYKKGMVSVSIGDYVDVYVYKTLDLPVCVNEEKNIIKLKKFKLPFYHMNKYVRISVFNDIVLFKGAIDVDCISGS